MCTVCREPILICLKCKLHLYQKQRLLRGFASSVDNDVGKADDNEMSNCVRNRAEYHCDDHFHLKNCYFTNLCGFSREELNKQWQELQFHGKSLEGIGKKGKQKRRTLRKQMEKIEMFVKRMMNYDEELNEEKSGRVIGGGIASYTNIDDSDVNEENLILQCRHCSSSSCDGDCWGFHGGDLRMTNQKKSKNVFGINGGNIGDVDDGAVADGDVEDGSIPIFTAQKARTRTPSTQRPTKRLKRLYDLSEIKALQLCQPPSQYRNNITGLRVPPPVVRTLRTTVKGRWCGKTIGWVLTHEFKELANEPCLKETNAVGKSGELQKNREESLEQHIAKDLIRINGVPLSKIFNSTTPSLSIPTKASDILLRNMDTIERIVHWHEPPIWVPQMISLTKHSLPVTVLGLDGQAAFEPTHAKIPLLYCINKPVTVPVYPAGPYYANSLLLMVEAQERLPPKTLIPCHRIDRATSGVLLCANMPSVASVIQGRMASCSKDGRGSVKKLYLARVKVRL